MSTSNNGKNTVLIILIVVMLLFALRSIFLILPFGLIPGLSHTIRDAGHAFWPLGGGGFVRFSLIFLPLALMALWIYVIIWVYRDAEKRGMNGLLWALLCFIGNVVGLIIYLIIRSDAAVKVHAPAAEACPACGTAVGTTYTFCPNCGAKLKPVCPGCQKPVNRTWKVCPACGTSLDPGKIEQA